MTPVKSKEEIVEEFRIKSIKEAAMRVIGRKGLSGANMQEIADEAGISKGTIYLYFKNQQELMDAVVDHASGQLLVQLQNALGASGSFRHRFETVLAHHLEFFDTHRDLFQVHIAVKFPDSDPRSARCDRESRAQYQTYFNTLVKFLEDGIARGEIRQANPRRLALFIEEGVGAVMHERMTEKNPPPVKEEVEWISSAILDGITRRRSRS